MYLTQSANTEINMKNGKGIRNTYSFADYEHIDKYRAHALHYSCAEQQQHHQQYQHQRPKQTASKIFAPRTLVRILLYITCNVHFSLKPVGFALWYRTHRLFSVFFFFSRFSVFCSRFIVCLIHFGFFVCCYFNLLHLHAFRCKFTGSSAFSSLVFCYCGKYSRSRVK